LSTKIYPDFVRQRFEQLHTKTGIPIIEIQAEFDKIFESSEGQAKVQFPSATPEQRIVFRQRYAVGKVWTDLVTRPPQEEMQVVYCGHGGLRYARGSLKPYCNMFVITQTPKGQLEINRVVARGALADIYRNLNFFTSYRVKLGRFANGGDLIVDTRSEFHADRIVNLPVEQFNSALNIPVVTVKGAVNNPSKQQGGWPIATDWRCIKGYVGGDPRTWMDKKDKKTPKGVCNIVDETVDEQPTVDDQGNIISPGLTAWTPPEHLIVNDGDYCAFYGTIGVSTDNKTGKKTAAMNCYLIRPIFTSSIPGEEVL